MAVNFGLLQPAAPVSAFFQGQQDVQAQAERNALRQMQAEQMAMQRENMLAQRGEREALAAERRRATEAQNALAAYSQSGQPMTPEALARFGAPGLALAKSLREEHAGRIEQELKVLEYASRRLAAATPETYVAIRADLSGINPRFGASLPQEFNPEQVMSLARQGMSLKDQIESATRQTVVAPGATVLQGGKPIYTAPAAEKPYEPSELQKTLDDLSKAPPGSPQQKALQARVQMLTTREPKEPRETPIRSTKVELADGTIGVMNLDTGEVTPAKVGQQVAKGKPSAFAEKTAAQRKQLGVDLDRTIGELTEVSKKGGLIDQSTGSGAGRLVDVGAGFFGQATPGAIAAGKLAPIADMVLKMVPRFEGPQSDKDTKSYKEAAGQLADPTLPNEIRKQAALQIVRLMKARKNEFVTPDMATEGVGVAPRTPATGVDVSNPLLK